MMGTAAKVWMDHLTDEVFDRLCHCRSVRKDLPELVNARWLGYREAGKDKLGFTKEDALVAVLELLDSNSCYMELTREEYDALCR